MQFRQISLCSVVGPLLLLGATAYAAAPVVSGVAAQQRNDGSKLVDIHYNLSDADVGEVLHVYIQVSEDGGATFGVNAVTLSGDIGTGVAAGSGKHIVWSAGNDIPGEYGENFRVRVTAWDSSLDSDPSRQMVYIPAGTFEMGQLGIAAPVHSVTLDAFLIDRTEVTKEEYAKFISAGGYLKAEYWEGGGVQVNNPSLFSQRPPYYSGDSAEPAAAISWHEARAYCAWRGKRLPTEAEWERTARGTSGRLFPWGDSIPTCALANFFSCGLKVKPVGSLPAGASPEGVLDLAGNLFEWVSDRAACAYPAQPVFNPVCDISNPSWPNYRTMRGGAYNQSEMLSATRSYAEPYSQSGVFGFRCAQSAN